MDALPVDQDLLQLLGALQARNYRFTAVTPETHKRVLAREEGREARTLRDVFGWNRPFSSSLLPADILDLLHRADAIEPVGGLLKSKLRVAAIEDALFLHSAYPTDDAHSVFFGPDTYRFVRLIRQALCGGPAYARLVDVGAGSGAGALMAETLMPGARVTMTDINPDALRLARVNAANLGIEIEQVEAPGLDGIEGAVDLVLANPPFVMDEADRAYRNGGGMHGAALSLDWTLAAAERLEPGGKMLLYTGVAIVEGEDALHAALLRELPDRSCTLDYSEIDPDIFGEELDGPLYAEVERIAAVAAIIERC
jgi:methylase of polypeptide subunit release factors